MSHITGFSIALVLSVMILLLGEPWTALVAFVGPVLAWTLSLLGVSAAGILTFLSGGGNFPLVAGVGFLITLSLAAVSLFI